MSHPLRPLIGAIFGFALLAPLAAEDASASNTDIVVTATKEPVSAATLPVAVTVLDQDDLAGKSTVSEALDSTLAVRTSSLTPGQPALSGPGFGENGFGRISFLVDGFAQNNPDQSSPAVNLIPAFALDRIEVLRGPASALYGNGAVAGAVNLVTKVPHKAETEVLASVESTGTNHQSVSIGAPVSKGGLLLSVQRDQNLPSRDRSDSDGYQAWTKFSYPLSWFGFDHTLTAWAAFTRSSTQLPGSLTESQYRADPDQAVNRADVSSTTQTLGGASWATAGDGWSLTVPVAASHRLVRSEIRSYYTPAFTNNGLTQSSIEPRADLQLGTWLGAQWDWSAGLGIALVHLDSRLYTDSSFVTTSMTAQIDRTSASLWNRIQAGWGDSLYVSASARIEASQTKASSDETPAIRGTRDFWPISGQVGVTWLPLQGLKVGLEADRVFRYPFIDEMISYQGYAPGFVTTIDPEVGHGLTASTSWAWSIWTVTASGTILRMENEVGFDPATFTSANLGPTWHGSGLGTVKASVVPGADVGVDYAYEVAQFASGADDGKVVPLVPNHRGRLWARVEATQWGAAEAGWSLASGYYQGGDNANSKAMVDGRQTLDAALTAYLGSPDLALKLYGRNLTDDRTPNYVYYSGWYPTEGRVLGTLLVWHTK